jgi:hypothetical protein
MAREIRDHVEAIAVELDRRAASGGRTAEELREGAIAIALAIMTRTLAFKAGLRIDEPCFGLDADLGLSRTGLAEASDRLDGWMVRHGREDPLGTAYETLLEVEAVRDRHGQVRLDFRPRGRRTSSGSFYTPASLVEFTLDRGLNPVLDAATAGFGGTEAVRNLLETSVLDPAVGGGRFLVAAARRIAARVKTLGGEDRLAEVLRRCVHGIDIDPTAAEICRIQLWLAVRNPAISPSAFAANVRTGNALLGTTRAMVESGIPDEAYRVRSGDDRSECALLRRRNRTERNLAVVKGELDPSLAADLWCAAFLSRKRDGQFDVPTTGDLRDTDRLPEPMRRLVADIAARERLFHTELAFPEVFGRGGFDSIVGNPPFLNQLETGTASDRARAAILNRVSDGSIRGYADISAAFLERCSRWLAPGGRLALVQPQSILAARDAEAIRGGVLRRCSLTDLWIARERVFGAASVHVCLPVLARTADRSGSLSRFVGKDFRRLADRAIDQDAWSLASTWAPLAAAASGVPEIEDLQGGTIGDLAESTADFRDQYYGLDGFLVDDADIASADRRADQYPKLVTTGLIDLAACRWGSDSTRVLKRRWNAPRIDRGRMAREGTLDPWITARLRTKIILATQTRVLELFVDADGEFIPSLPLITITPRLPGDLWKVAAAIASPVATAIAFARHDGAAMTVDAIKLSASQTLQLPNPTDASWWQRGAERLEEAHRAPDARTRESALRAFGAVMVRSYGLPVPLAADVESWWAKRLCV